MPSKRKRTTPDVSPTRKVIKVEENKKTVGLQDDCKTYVFPSGFEMPLNFIMTIPAPKNSGKSWFIRQFLHCDMTNLYEYIIIVCPSLKLNRDYDEFREDERFTFLAEPKESDLEEIFLKQYTCMAKVKKREDLRMKYIQKHLDIPVDQIYPSIRMPKTLLIVDDCLDSGIMKFSGVLDTYAARGRHSDLAVIATTQRFRGITPTLRINSDFVAVFTPYSVVECEKFFEEFVSQSDRKTLRLMLKELFKIPFHFILVNNTLRSYNEKLFLTKAEAFVQGIMTPIVLPDMSHNQNGRGIKRSRADSGVESDGVSDGDGSPVHQRRKR